MLSRLTSRKGETVVEILVAVMLLVVGALSSVRLLGLANINTQLTKERVIATNLAREGLEAVRTIRDTNWLRFKGERRLCWNNLDATKCEDAGSGIPVTHIGQEHRYLAKFNLGNYRWELSESSQNPLDLSDGIDEEYRLKFDTGGLYNHDGTDTIYFREIYTEYLDPDQSLALDETANILRVTSKVEWIDRGRFSSVILTTILTDHLGRKNHD